VLLVALLISACSSAPRPTQATNEAAPSQAAAASPEPSAQPAPPTASSGPRRLSFPFSGLELTVPGDAAVDQTLAPAFIRIAQPHLDIKVSRERSPYVEMDYYFDTYLNRFILDPTYRSTNQIRLVDDQWTTVAGYRTRLISFERTPAAGSPETQNQYLFAYVITEGQQFYNFFFRTDSLAEQRSTIDTVLQSFKPIPVEGTASFQVDFKPVLPKWNQETADLYRQLTNANTVRWGIFTPWALTKD
jgi:hypothetical protein